MTVQIGLVQSFLLAGSYIFGFGYRDRDSGVR